MRKVKASELERYKSGINDAIAKIKEYGYQDKYKDLMEGNHYGFIAAVDAIDIIERSLRDGT